MSLALNGTSQYVDLGDAVNIRSATPILVVAVVDTTGLPSATRGLFSQGDYNANTGYGAFAYGGPPKSQGMYGARSGGNTSELDLASAIPADDGWYLIGLKYYATGSAPNIVMTGRVQAYSYTHATWTSEDVGNFATGLSATTFQVPAAGQHTLIGALYGVTSAGVVGQFWPTQYSWIAFFNNDGGGGGTEFKNTAIAAELIANGFWNLLDGNCLGAWAFNGNTTDRSAGGHNGTLVGSPSYGAVGPGEAQPGGVVHGTMTTMTRLWGP